MKVRAGQPARSPGETLSELPDRLAPVLARALRTARRTGRPVLASFSQRLAGLSDPLGSVLALRQAGEPWFALEQPERNRSAIATLGCAHELTASGAQRFTELSERWRELVHDAAADPSAGPPGSGLAAFGGFAFAPGGGEDPVWKGFAPASLIVPELTLVRRGEETWLTLNAEVAPDDTIDERVARLTGRATGLRPATLPLLDPAPAGRFRVRSAMPPAHYEEAVTAAVERIVRGELSKVVLAREVQVEAPAAYDPAAVLGVLREGFPGCFVYAVGRGEATFLGASPELLVRREGQRASTVALAGSTRRSADPAVDAHLGERLLRSEKDREENAIVGRRIARALQPLSVWVTVAPEPVVIKVANIQHLAAPIRAQLRDAVPALELAGALHPTPAVGGEPGPVAHPLIPALEGFDRGWYAGAVGWTDATKDGEFLVALRCALLRGDRASCYAGAGIVRDSDPAAELAETEVKLGALLPVLAG